MKEKGRGREIIRKKDVVRQKRNNYEGRLS